MADRRIFIAIDISDEVRRQIAAYIEDVSRITRACIKWERPEKLHLTLKFIGDAGPDRITAIGDAVKSIAERHIPFIAEAAGTGVFPNVAAPRVLWIGVKSKADEIPKIAADIEDVCADLGFRREERSFHPHTTIARIRDPRSARELANIHLGNGFGPIAFDVKSITIYESKLLPAGSIYSVVSTHAIGIGSA